VQQALPIIVLHLLGKESVGYYKAATAISMSYLGFLAAAMALDFYPRVSAVKEQPRALVELINQQHRLVMILAVPMILGTLALLPYAVPIVYSRKFVPTVVVLEWQLIGDLFKFSSWTMAYAILARCRSSVYFLTESIGGLANIVTLWLAVRWFGLSGLGISFLVSYIIYYAAVWVIIRREIHLVWTVGNKMMMLASVAAALLVRALPSTSLANLRTPTALLLALLAGAWSLHAVWGELGGRKEIRAA
jgi:PST family polysaccharide transporter